MQPTRYESADFDHLVRFVRGKPELHIVVQQSAVAKSCNVPGNHSFAGHDPGKNQIGRCGAGVHRAGRQIENRDISPLREPEHAARMERSAEGDHLGADHTECQRCRIERVDGVAATGKDQVDALLEISLNISTDRVSVSLDIDNIDDLCAIPSDLGGDAIPKTLVAGWYSFLRLKRHRPARAGMV